MEKRAFRTLDLFAGVGGIRLAFENAGFQTVFANDFDKTCKETYDLNFSEPKLLVKDIFQIDVLDLPEFDILVAGFPCQGFSIAGRMEGLEGESVGGNCFFKIKEILKYTLPKAILLENVKNLKGHDKGRTFQIIKDTLEKLGYHIKAEVLNSMKHGNIPQNRERIFIVGFLDEEKIKAFEFPKEINLTRNFREFIEEEVDEKFHYEGKPLFARIKDHIISKNTVYQWRRKYVRENKKGVVPTLTANMGTGGHNVPIIKTDNGIRKLTPKECFMLQGFPEEFKLPDNLSGSALFHQAGNSVTVPVVQRIAENMMNALTNEKQIKQIEVVLFRATIDAPIRNKLIEV